MVDEAKVQSSMNSTIGALIVQHAVQVCPGEAGPLWTLTNAAVGAAAFWCACHGLAEHTSQMSWFDQIHWSCSRPDKQQTTQLWLWPSYGASLALESTLDSPQSNHWAGHQQLSYLIHFSVTHHSLIKKWFIIVGKKKRCTNWKHFSKKNVQPTHEESIYQVFLLFQFASNVKWPWMVHNDFSGSFS